MKALTLAIAVSLLAVSSADAAQSREHGFFGDTAKIIGVSALNALVQPTPQTGMQPYAPGMPGAPGVPPSLYERKQETAIASTMKNEEAINVLSGKTQDVSNTYEELQRDISGPLAQQTAALKAQKDRLLRTMSSLTKTLRVMYDKLHPEMAGLPLVIVPKTKDDELRAESNKIDTEGALDTLKGIATPCAAFHKERDAEKQVLKEPSTSEKLEIEANTLSKLNPKERGNYDAQMITDAKNEAKQLQNAIKAAENDEKTMAHSGAMMANAAVPYMGFTPTAGYPPGYAPIGYAAAA